MGAHKQYNVLPHDFVSIPNFCHIAVNNHQLRAVMCSETSPYHQASTAVGNSLYNTVVCTALFTSAVHKLTAISSGQLKSRFVSE